MGGGLFTRMSPYRIPANKPTANETRSTFIRSPLCNLAKSNEEDPHFKMLSNRSRDSRWRILQRLAMR